MYARNERHGSTTPWSPKLKKDTTTIRGTQDCRYLLNLDALAVPITRDDISPRVNHRRGKCGVEGLHRLSFESQAIQTDRRPPESSFQKSTRSTPESISLAEMDNEDPIPRNEHVQSVDNPTAVQHVNKKMDICLLPFLSLLYLFSGLDRSNIGNAETQGTRKRNTQGAALPIILSLGFSRDIGVTPDDVNLAVSLFFVTFVLLQPASAAVGRWLGAKHWITLMMVRFRFRSADHQ
jgi:hypothetical protein